MFNGIYWLVHIQRRVVVVDRPIGYWLKSLDRLIEEDLARVTAEEYYGTIDVLRRMAENLRRPVP
jgi:hypothetical protein